MGKQFLKVFRASLFLVSLAGSVYAQSTTDSTTIDVAPKTKLEISIEGLSRAIYSGRNYGVNQYGLNPGILFNHKSGLNLNFYSYGMSETPGLLTETDLGASFTFHISRILNITPGYTYLINSEDSSAILKHSLNVATSLELPFISLNNYLAFSFGTSTAWYDEVTASKYFSLLSKGKTNLAVSPTFVWVLGTKMALTTIGHGSTAYQQKVYRTVGNGKGKRKSGTTTTSTEVDTSQNFMPLSYEFLLPITISYRTLAFTLIPHFSIPVNLAPAESTLTGNPFYLTAKITYPVPFAAKKK